MLVMKPSQILRQRYTSCLSGMGLTSTKKVGTQRGLLGWVHTKGSCGWAGGTKKTEAELWSYSSMVEAWVKLVTKQSTKTRFRACQLCQHTLHNAREEIWNFTKHLIYGFFDKWQLTEYASMASWHAWQDSGFLQCFDFVIGLLLSAW